MPYIPTKFGSDEHLMPTNSRLVGGFDHPDYSQKTCLSIREPRISFIRNKKAVEISQSECRNKSSFSIIQQIFR